MVWVDHGYGTWDKCNYKENKENVGNKVNENINVNVNNNPGDDAERENNYTSYINSKSDDLMDVILYMIDSKLVSATKIGVMCTDIATLTLLN